MEVISESTQETKGFGRKMAADVISCHPERTELGSGAEGSHYGKDVSKKNGAVVLALTGNLGSGKTTFVQGLAEGLGIKQRIISPTFIILRNYELRIKNKGKKFKNFYHVDLYRLEENSPGGEASIEKELTNLGLKEIWSDPKNIVAIEWAEKAKDVIPKNAIWIEFENKGKSKRNIKIGE